MEKKRILIIDDEPAFTRMVKLNLEKNGAFEVREENKATSALASAREYKPDLILLDVIMPTLDGGDIAGQIEKDRHLRGTPVVFLTATVTPREAGPGGRLTSGGSVFVPKPVSLDNLIKCINENVRKPSEPDSEKAGTAG